MPRSKRNKVVPLTKVKKQGKSAKDDLKDHVQEAVDTYKNTFVVSFENMRAGPFKGLAHKARSDSKFFLGKNKVMQVALGRSSEDEYETNTSQLSKYLKGHVCLLSTNKTLEQLQSFISEEEVEDFAQAGCEATYTVFLPKGTDALDGYAHSLEPYLKQLGLPIRLNFQKLELISDVYVCREGKTLNVEQAKILKLLGHKMAKFTLTPLCQRSQKGKFKELEAGREFLLRNKGEDAGDMSD